MKEQLISFEKGQDVSFTYRGRNVRGIVTWSKGRGVELKLISDYKGKNVYWEQGELKDFDIKLIEKCKIH